MPKDLCRGQRLLAASCAVVLLGIIFTFVTLNRIHQHKLLDAAQSKFVGRSTINLSDISKTAQGFRYLYQTKNKKASAATSGLVDSGNGTAYSATLPRSNNQPLLFSDSSSSLQISLRPEFRLSDGSLSSGHVSYNLSSTQRSVYTYKRNGVKEDILLTRAPGSSASFRWHMVYDGKLSARLLPDGGVGFFSGDPTLYGNLQIEDSKSQDLIDKARSNGPKNHLVFVLPRPYIKDANGQIIVKSVSYSLKNSILTLIANGLKNLSYPISIDPTVTVTTTADFRTGNDDGMVDYSTADQINRSNVTTGVIGSWNYTAGGNSCSTWTSPCNSGFNTPRYGHTTVAYNGYLYVIGGLGSASANDCTANQCNGIQITNLSTTTASGFGTDGSWNYTAGGNSCSSWTSPCNTGFTQARGFETSVAYNGYLYVIGGKGPASSNDCNSSGYCNGVQFAAINSNGTIGAWNYTAGGNSCSTWTSPCTSSFIQPREFTSAVAYNGYMYVVGGYGGVTSNDCNIGSCKGVQFAPINNDGTIGSWNYTFNGNSCSTWTSPCNNGFNTPRYGLTLVPYSGYLYVIGGLSTVGGTDCSATSSYCNGTQFAAINSNGTIGAWNYTAGGNSCSTWTSPCNSGFTQARSYHTSVAYNGYLYVIGGQSGSSGNDCTATNNLCNGTQFAAINSNGTIGAWNYTAGGNSCSTWTSPCNSGFTQARSYHTSVAYNGYLYVIGGQSGSSGNDCTVATFFYCNGTQFAAINSNGTIGAWNYTAGGNSCSTWTSPCNSGFNTPRYGHTTVAYNGYLYVIGGQASASGNDCTATNNFCNGTQYTSLNSPAQRSHYERIIDTGASNNTINSVVFNGKAVCGAHLVYSLAGSSNSFGSTAVIYNAIPGNTYTINQTNERYVWIDITLDDTQCGTNSNISDISVNYTAANSPPLSPSLSTPSSGATDTTLIPAFNFSATDPDSDDIQFKINLFQSDCSTSVTTYDMASGQSGWSPTFNGSAGSGMTYTSSTSGSGVSFTPASALSGGTTYCWSVSAKDPGGSNTTTTSGTQLFTTSFVPGAPALLQPSDGQTGLVVKPDFKLSSADQDIDYLNYEIQICSNSSCSSVVRTICQVSDASHSCIGSQSGWASQSQQSATAYSSSQTAVYTYQFTDLSPNTQYWWRAYAIDPGGSNTWSSASAINSFTIENTSTSHDIKLQGNINVQGGVCFGSC